MSALENSPSFETKKPSQPLEDFDTIGEVPTSQRKDSSQLKNRSAKKAVEILQPEVKKFSAYLGPAEAVKSPKFGVTPNISSIDLSKVTQIKQYEDATK